MNLKVVNTIFLSCLTILLLVISGCSSSDSETLSTGAVITENVLTTTAANTVPATDTTPVKEMRIKAYNFGFTQEPVTIKKGDHVRLILTSTSGAHGVMIPDLSLSTDAFLPGEEQIIEFTADKVGTFSYFCNVPCGKGHREMHGQLVVEE